MRRWTLTAVAMATGLALVIGISFAQEAKKPEAAVAKVHAFVGADGCKLCHKLEAKGDQYGKWLAGPHANAFKTLGTEEAKKVAEAKGLKGNPQELAECLSCHVTTHGVKAELVGPKVSIEEGVSCESCHGAGADYKAKKVMEDRAASVAAGLIIPTEETCKKCHNEKNPTHKGFDFTKMSEKIAHPNPLKVKK